MAVAAQRPLAVAAVALAYYALARLGLTLALAGTSACPVWPASGLAFAAVLMIGPEAAIGVFVGSWIANYQNLPGGSTAALACAAVAAGSAAQAVLGTRIMMQRRTVLAQIGVVPPVCLIAATVGVGSLHAAGVVTRELAGAAWLTWWVGDVVGVAVFAPMLIARALERRISDQKADLWEAQATLRVAALGRREDGQRIQLYRRVVEELPVGLAVIRIEKPEDPESWVIIEMNEVGRRLSAAKEEDPTGKRLLEFAPEVRASELIRALAEAYDTNRVVEIGDFLSTTRVPGGRFAIKIFPLGPPLVGLAFENVTQRRLAEEALLRSQAELARSNTELTQFAYVASHDLQAPLRKAAAFAEHLRRRLGGEFDEGTRDFLDRLDRSLSGMQALIDALLALARVSTRSEPPASVDLAAVATEVVDDFQEQLERAGGRVEISALPVIVGDASQMRQLLQNLLGNALKFRRDGVPPVVRVSGRTLEDGSREFKVEDNGIGFEMKYAERVFEPFQRLVSAKDYPGTGMGLAICHKIVVRHGGRITVESRPGEGTAFTVVLPAP